MEIRKPLVLFHPPLDKDKDESILDVDLEILDEELEVELEIVME